MNFIFYLRNHVENKMLASGLLPAYCYYFLLKCWPLTTITTDQQTPSRTRSAVHTDSSYNLLSAAVIVIHAGRHKHNRTRHFLQQRTAGVPIIESLYISTLPFHLTGKCGQWITSGWECVLFSLPVLICSG